MCGKFTAKASWTEIVDLAWSDAPTDEDRLLTYRVMGNVPVIVRAGDGRCVVAMRWGFPHPRDWKRPQPIHARGETIDGVPAFADAFRDGQRGIVVVETFNEAPESGEQHVVNPAGPIGIAFLWRQFQIAALPEPLFACVMVTVPANRLLTGLPTDRMPAMLAQEDWETWLSGSPGAAKTCLKTVEDLRWTMTREARTKSAKRAKPTISDPAGLF
jgi:putative SOS response-associated peptidase YedK